MTWRLGWLRSAYLLILALIWLGLAPQLRADALER
jgi:hypothetical protein